MKKNIPYIVFLILVAFIFLAGCTSQSGEKTSNLTIEPSSKTTTPDGESSHNSTPILKQSSGSSVSTESKAGDSYYNIRIVPASELEKLEKEMGTDEFIVKNEKDFVIGIVSPRGLTLRGDLVQLESGLGAAGKEFDKTDAAIHLLDITFGLDNSKLNLFKSDKDYKFWFDAYYTDSDIKYILNLSKLLNTISGTTQFEDEEVALGFLQTNYDVIPYNFYNIKIVTEKWLDQYYDDKRKDSDHLIKNRDGNLIGIVNTEYLYLIDTLNDDDRKYYVLKGILYSMGLHGTSYKNKESFFYRNEGMNRNLSDLDLEAIKLLYGGGLKTGNTLEEARKTLGLST